METLEEFNRRRRREREFERRTTNLRRPKGIACPHCGAKLLDSNPNEILTSIPPQMDVHCEKCDFRGYRIA